MSTPPSPQFPKVLPGNIHSHLNPEYLELLRWQFPDEPFYIKQIKSLLEGDIEGDFLRDTDIFRMWNYRGSLDNQESTETLGFGTYKATNLYAEYCEDGKNRHGYIPVLSCHPDNSDRGIKGVGKQIVDHLKKRAGIFCERDKTLSRLLFLDVYVENEPAIKLYSNHGGFTILNPDKPLFDDKMEFKPYFIMAIKL